MRRQSWRLRVGSAQAAFAARARFRAEVEDLLPAFNDVFDAWAPGDTVLRIPRLELSLRVASLDDLAGALAEALRREAPRPAPAPTRPAAAERLALLLRYLETGMLDWHAAHAEAAETVALLRAVLLAQLRTAARSAPAGAAEFERAIQYYLRLLRLLPGEKWQEVAASIDPSHLPRHIETGGPEFATTGTEGDFRLDDPGLVAAIRSIDAARARLGEQAALPLAAAILAVSRAAALSAGRLQAALSQATGSRHSGEVPAPVARFLAARLAAADAAGAPGTKRRFTPSSSTAQGGVAQPAPAHAPQAFALMASNAGLVLLHPFLPRLFEACDLCEPRGRLEPRLLPRAAALLHWLAAGRDEVHEFELGAVKLLLGLPPESPLALGADLLGERERDEGEALLRAAIEHWKALKRTSVAGLRVSFLQRRGALREENTGWRLQLEPESFDVLLKQLPWGIATVKLPWMIRPLYTDWPTP